jgi:phosphatidylglycerophosphate synthase
MKWQMPITLTAVRITTIIVICSFLYQNHGYLIIYLLFIFMEIINCRLLPHI